MTIYIRKDTEHIPGAKRPRPWQPEVPPEDTKKTTIYYHPDKSIIEAAPLWLRRDRRGAAAQDLALPSFFFQGSFVSSFLVWAGFMGFRFFDVGWLHGFSTAYLAVIF
jgi:hypothetical protein